MTQYVFATGQLYATPVGGGAPLRVGALQDVSVEFSGDVKQLFGQYQFPLDVARGKTKVEGKIGTGNIDVSSFNQLFFGQTVTTNTQKVQAQNEAHSIPATPGPYTVTAANAADFYLDLGVYLVSTGEMLRQVSGVPASGEYSVNAGTGVYTFNAAQQGAAILLNYIYDSTTTGSGTLDINNQLMGVTPKFQLLASQTYNNKTFTLCLYSVVADKLSMPLKQDDYLISEVSYQASANATNQIGFISTTSATGGGA